MKNKPWTTKENQILKELYSIKKISEIIKLTDRTPEGIRKRANRLGLKINRSLNKNKLIRKNHKLNIAKKAEIIEAYVNNPNIQPDELGVTRSFFIDCISLWFKYKGDNSIVLVLESKV